MVVQLVPVRQTGALFLAAPILRRHSLCARNLKWQYNPRFWASVSTLGRVGEDDVGPSSVHTWEEFSLTQVLCMLCLTRRHGHDSARLQKRGGHPDAIRESHLGDVDDAGGAA